MTQLYHGTRWQDDLAAAIGNTPLIRLRRASEATGCTILGKAEFMNPGGSVKDRAGLAIITDAERRGALQARRHGRRGHRRQHRHRADPGRQRARLSLRHRDAGDAEPGEDRFPAHDRRRSAAGAGQAVSRSRQLRARLAPAGRGDRRASGPTSSTTWPTARAIATTHRARDLGADRRHAWMPSPAPAAPAARWPALALALKARNPAVRIVLADPRGQRPVWLGEEQRPDRCRAARSPRASASRACPATWRARRSTTPSAFPTPRRWSRSTTC